MRTSGLGTFTIRTLGKRILRIELLRIGTLGTGTLGIEPLEIGMLEIVKIENQRYVHRDTWDKNTEYEHSGCCIGKTTLKRLFPQLSLKKKHSFVF